MAHRIIAQVVFIGTRVVGRAFAEAWRQASASSQYAKAGSSSSGATKNNLASHGLTVDEACKILNVAPPQGAKPYADSVTARFKRLFDQNNPEKGGSFYLQSKILRARERIELELRETQEKVAREQELKEGWKPKMYKD